MLVHKNLAGQSKQQGMTLVELVIGVAILGIISAIAVPSYTEYIANAQIRTTTESIRNGLQVARAEAVKRNATVAFTLNSTDTSWVVGCPTVRANCPATIQTKTAREGGSTTVTVAITGANAVSFTNLGNITTAAGQLSAYVILTLVQRLILGIVLPKDRILNEQLSKTTTIKKVVITKRCCDIRSHDCATYFFYGHISFSGFTGCHD